MTALQVTLMTGDEARATVERIKGTLEDVRALLWELHEREGWRALGYATWQDCIRDEFAMSRMHAHRLLNAFVVDRMLAAGGNVTNGYVRADVATIPEAHARELEPLTADPEVVREVHAAVLEATDGTPTAADYRAAVARRLGTAHPDDERAMSSFVLPDQEVESDEERAYFTLSRQRLLARYRASRVADTPADPAMALPAWEEFEGWFLQFMAALRARAARPIRLADEEGRW